MMKESAASKPYRLPACFKFIRVTYETAQVALIGVRVNLFLYFATNCN